MSAVLSEELFVAPALVLMRSVMGICCKMGVLSLNIVARPPLITGLK
jgi:hypothetical protein